MRPAIVRVAVLAGVLVLAGWTAAFPVVGDADSDGGAREISKRHHHICHCCSLSGLLWTWGGQQSLMCSQQASYDRCHTCGVCYNDCCDWPDSPDYGATVGAVSIANNLPKFTWTFNADRWTRCNGWCHLNVAQYNPPCRNGKKFRIRAINADLGTDYSFDSIPENAREFNSPSQYWAAGHYNWYIEAMRRSWWGASTLTWRGQPSNTGSFCITGPPEQALLSLPVSGAVVTSATVTFVWRRAANLGVSCLPSGNKEAYTLYISNSSMTTPSEQMWHAVASTTDDTAQYPYTFTESGRYWWVVVTGNGATISMSSPAFIDVCLLRPTVTAVAPAENAVLTASAVTFSWNTVAFSPFCGVGPVTYTLQFAPPLAASPTTISGISGTWQQRQLSAIGDYSWFVSASNGYVTSQASAVRVFARCNIVPPAAPVLDLPASGVRLEAGDDIEFTWSYSATDFGITCTNVPSTNSLALTVRDASDAEVLNESLDSVARSFVLGGGFGSGTYRWRVTATSGSGTTTSVERFFTVGVTCVPVSPSDLALVAPAADALIVGGAVTLEWSIGSTGNPCDATGAQYFELFFGTDPSPLNNAPISTNQLLTYDASGLAADTYYWAARFTNANGDTTVSSVSQFSVCLLSAVQSPAITYPESASTHTSAIQLEWTAATPASTCGEESDILYTVSGTCGGCTDAGRLTSVSVDVATLSHQFRTDTLAAGAWTFTVTANSAVFDSSAASTAIHVFVCHVEAPAVPFLESPLQRSANLHPNSTLIFRAADFNVGACGGLTDGYRYELYLAADANVTAGAPIQVYDNSTYGVLQLNASSTLAYQLSNAAAGLWFWTVRAVKEVNGTTLATMAPIRQFYVCHNVPPVFPRLVSPSNASDYDLLAENATLVFSWMPIAQVEYGVVCPYSGANFEPLVYLYLEDMSTPLTTPLTTLAYTQSSTADLSAQVFGDTEYHWRIMVSNGHATVESDTFTFKVLPLPATPVPTDPTGEDPPNQGQPLNEAPSNVPLIVGLVIMAIVLLVIVAFIVLFVVRRRRLSEKQREFDVKMNVVPPDFQALAFPSPQPLHPETRGSGWESFRRLLLADNYILVFTLLRASSSAAMDDLVRPLIVLYESAGAAPKLVNFLISHELRTQGKSGALTSTTLFRNDNHASKAFSAYARIVGLRYLWETFGPLLAELQASEDAEREASERVKTLGGAKSSAGAAVVSLPGRTFAGNLEVDPNKLTDEDDSDVNRLLLELMAERFLNAISASGPYFPEQLRSIMHHVKLSVARALPGAEPAAIGGFVFLRFINVALVVPTTYGLLRNQPSSSLHRQLVLITKMLQNLVNGTTFNEDHMAGLNDFVERNRGKIYKYFEVISEPQYNDFKRARLDDDEEQGGRFWQRSVMSLLPSRTPSTATLPRTRSELHVSSGVVVDADLQGMALAKLYKITYTNMASIREILTDGNLVPKQSGQDMLGELQSLIDTIGHPKEPAE